MWRKWKRYASLSGEHKRLLLEAFLYLGWARILKALPFSKVAPTLGQHMAETTEQPNHVHAPMIKQVSFAVQFMSRHTWWESQCMVKAIAAMRMLERRKIESTLYMGMGRDEKGKLVAHAWLRSGPFYITGAEGRERYTCVAMFARQMEGSVK
ncbi:lasso peptide biosynthesis B2 protein [Paenibacillus pinihumi]|uniref:lasso peptide biosynthesis B2 protein n=1 Tax=Paenibacillus pinihumi TaxID=669462 RepID=UPI0003F65222|nr:lasso peptide biosynthesis B2 protein [Paenibacillus pinihumi]